MVQVSSGPLTADHITQPTRRSSSKTARKYGHLWFVLPGLLFFGAVMIFPILFALVISLTDWTGLGTDYNFVGLQNFQHVLTSWPFYRAAINNLWIFIAILTFQHTVGLFIAVQLNEKPRFMEFYRTVLFLPVIISLVSTGFIWTLMLSSNIGFINPVLRDLGRLLWQQHAASAALQPRTGAGSQDRDGDHQPVRAARQGSGPAAHLGRLLQPWLSSSLGQAAGPFPRPACLRLHRLGRGYPIGKAVAAMREAEPQRFAVRTSGRTGKWGSFTLPFPTDRPMIGDAAVCPEQRDAMAGTGRGAHCGSCGLCWKTGGAATGRPIAFVEH